MHYSHSLMDDEDKDTVAAVLRERDRKLRRKHFREHRERHSRHRLRSLEDRMRSRSKSPKKKSARRKSSQYWDVPAPGFEHIAPVESKSMQATGKKPANSMPDICQKVVPVAEGTRQERLLHIRNIPFGITEDEMVEFFGRQIHMAGIAQAKGQPVIACQINLNKNDSFLELRSIYETTHSIKLDGLQFKGQRLKIRRPPLDNQVIADSVNIKLEVKEEVVDEATNAGNGQVPSLTAVTTELPPTEVLCLFNMLTSDELKDDGVNEKILDIVRECRKYGVVQSIKIECPVDGTDIRGYRNVFIEYNTIVDCQKAHQALSGRKFNNRILLTSFTEPAEYQNIHKINNFDELVQKLLS